MFECLVALVVLASYYELANEAVFNQTISSLLGIQKEEIINGKSSFPNVQFHRLSFG